MGRSKLDRVKRLLEVQNQLLKIEETKAAELKQQKHQLEEAEQEALEFLNRVDLASRFAALSVKRPFLVRQKIVALEERVTQQNTEVRQQTLGVRRTERVLGTCQKQADREESNEMLMEITEAALLRSRFV